MTLKHIAQGFLAGALILGLLIATITVAYAQQQPQRPSDAAINGRLESQAATISAITNECAARTGGLYDALEKAGAEINKLRTELEALKPKPKS